MVLIQMIFSTGTKKQIVDKSHVYTIGDCYSDIEMIRNFNGYWMEESVDELKALAKKKVASVSVLVNELMED